MIRCLIVDDEPIAIRVLQTHLEKVPHVAVAGTCTNAFDALKTVKEEGPDLVFLDIEMPGLSGIGFIESLASPPRFIFTTAHRDYALRGYELDAVDYLLKPISLPRLLRAIEKYLRLEPPAGFAASDIDQVDPEPILVHVDRRTVRVDPREILFAESLSDYVVIHTEAGKLTAKLRLSDLEEQLVSHGFLRIHRSYVAPLHRIDAFTSTEIQIGETILPVSRTYRQQVMGRLRESPAAEGSSRGKTS